MATESGSSSRVQKTTSSDGAVGSARTTRTDTGASSSGAVTLVSMDGDGFVVEASAIEVSKLLKAMVDGPTENAAKEIPLTNMRSNVVAKVVEFCQHHQTDPMTDIPKPVQFGKTVGDHVQEWYSTFVKALKDEMLFEMLLAANYLDLSPLLELCAATVGLRAMNKTPEEIQREFNIKEPFSPEVERTLRQENKWSTEPPIGS
ncbi:conserved unknown protein [Ectocarpus siliculosus]|uniref:SKP1-like protein n=1 Tax=Ectocarpus siliculosus TaxID=2880 RepID=D7G2Z2_ECTSI|nr:conserved unknown protein [Ectocarpus siliculosus]|eukprot:CBJ48849.1 conserved unknown protein [Ectocarpus siliculosus]